VWWGWLVLLKGAGSPFFIFHASCGSGAGACGCDACGWWCWVGVWLGGTQSVLV